MPTLRSSLRSACHWSPSRRSASPAGSSLRPSPRQLTDGKIACIARYGRPVTTISWRGAFTNAEVNELHAESFQTKVFDESEWDWVALTRRHSLGWVVARQGTELVGFVNVVWDGLVHAWLQDTMVARTRGLR